MRFFFPLLFLFIFVKPTAASMLECPTERECEVAISQPVSAELVAAADPQIGMADLGAADWFPGEDATATEETETQEPLSGTGGSAANESMPIFSVGGGLLLICLGVSGRRRQSC